MIKEESRFVPSSVMEGIVSFRAVIAGIESGISDRKITRVMYDTERAGKHAGELSYIKAMSYKHDFEVEGVGSGKIDAVAVGSSHGGIITLCSDRTIPALKQSDLPENGFFMLLDGIEDPYNFGYALRSIAAAGADGVILPERNWMSAAGVVCRASAGASETLPLYVCEPATASAVFRSAGYKVVCADIKNSVPMWEADLSRPLLLTVGGEKRGISKALLLNADSVVRIDYGRETGVSLSAASASSILAFEVLRQNK